jgi:very-short-patch-repair endonuclease
MSLSTDTLKQAKKYDKLNDDKKLAFINQAYHDECGSYQVIAEAVGTYANKIRRDARKLGVAPKTKSQAQSEALQSGRHKHPTKGTQRDEATKVKISETRSIAWENMSDAERKRLSNIGKEQWNNKSPAERRKLQQAAGDAIRQASQDGSKLERFLRKQLIKEGYYTEFHKKKVIKNVDLEVDIWLPKLNVAIEIDGPSHFEPIWGEKTLARNQRADAEKTGLILARGMVLIRLRQTKNISEKLKRDLLTALLETLEDVKKKFPPKHERHIIIGD